MGLFHPPWAVSKPKNLTSSKDYQSSIQSQSIQEPTPVVVTNISPLGGERKGGYFTYQTVGGGTSTLYTVPAGKRFYLTFWQFGLYSNENLTRAEGRFYTAKGSTLEFPIAIDVDVATKLKVSSNSFTPAIPHILESGESLIIFTTCTAGQVVTAFGVWGGYEVPT